MTQYPGLTERQAQKNQVEYGENLLAQRYEINAGYPMPRATVMAGINLNF